MSAVVKVLVALAGASAALAGVTGCATKAVPYKTPSSATTAPSSAGSAAPAPTEPMSPLPAATGQLTGTQLQTVLLPQSSFPAGFALSPSSAVSSGGSLSSFPARYDLATTSCATFVSHLGEAGFGETAMASNSFVSQQRQALDQLVYQFRTAGEAAAFVSGVKSLADRCGSFTVTASGVTGTFSLRAAQAAAVGGHPSLDLVQTGTLRGTPVTLDTLFTASGVDVFAGAAVGAGVSPPAGMAKETIVYHLMKRQAAAAVLG